MGLLNRPRTLVKNRIQGTDNNERKKNNKNNNNKFKNNFNNKATNDDYNVENQGAQNVYCRDYHNSNYSR